MKELPAEWVSSFDPRLDKAKVPTPLYQQYHKRVKFYRYFCQKFGDQRSSGTIFSLSLPLEPPQLAIKASDVDVVLTWATNNTGFTLVCTTDLDSPVWTTVVPAPIVLNGEYLAKTPLSSIRQFYRPHDLG